MRQAGASEARGRAEPWLDVKVHQECPVFLKAKGFELSSDSHSSFSHSFSPSASSRSSQCVGHQWQSFSFPPGGHMLEAHVSHTTAAQPSALQRCVVGRQCTAA